MCKTVKPEQTLYIYHIPLKKDFTKFLSLFYITQHNS